MSRKEEGFVAVSFDAWSVALILCLSSPCVSLLDCIIFFFFVHLCVACGTVAVLTLLITDDEQGQQVCCPA